MRVGELFAGIGGFGLAAQRAGARVLWCSEIEPFAARVYAERFPDVRQLGDVTKVEDAEPVDCLTAGFPCQDLSVAGKRKGLIGARSGLFWEITRLAARLRPRWLLLENVPGLLSSHRGRDFETVLAALDELGYGVAWRVLDAQFFGVPQRRRRVFIVGHLGGPCPAEVLFEPEGVPGDTPARRQARAGVTQSLTRSLGSGGADDNDAQGGLLVIEDQAGTRHAIARPITATSYKGHDEDTDTIVAHALSSEGADASEDGTGRGTPIVASVVSNGDAHSGFRDEHGVIAGTVRTHNRNNSDPTTEARALVCETRPRRLTPRECERLQGFPDDWTLIDGASDSARYRALGNAVEVNTATWILRRLVAWGRPPGDHTP